jgi:hypothetical protein
MGIAGRERSINPDSTITFIGPANKIQRLPSSLIIDSVINSRPAKMSIIEQNRNDQSSIDYSSSDEYLKLQQPGIWSRWAPI